MQQPTNLTADDERDLKIEDRINDAEADLMQGNNVRFKDCFDFHILTFNDVLQAVYDDDRFGRAFLEILKTQPKSELYALFAEHAREMANEYAEDEQQALIALAHERDEREAEYKAEMRGDLV